MGSRSNNKRSADEVQGDDNNGPQSVEALCQGVKRLKTNNWAVNQAAGQQLEQHLEQQLQQQQQQQPGPHAHPHHPTGGRVHSGDGLGPCTPALDDDDGGGAEGQGAGGACPHAESYRQVNLMLRALHFDRIARCPGLPGGPPLAAPGAG